MPPSSPPADAAADARSRDALILGADTVLAARPASPIQLVNACIAAGYPIVVPASWGDELVAAACLARLVGRGERPALLCACPHVATMLRDEEIDGDAVIALASPAAAAARYLRAVTGEPLRITFAGGCPGGGDPAIDVHFTAGNLLRLLDHLGLEPVAQPTVFGGELGEQWRRFYSIPGGFPDAAVLWGAAEREAVELDARGISRHLRGGGTLVDLAPRAGCSCTGARLGTTPARAREMLAGLEPPRATAPVVNTAVAVDMEPTPLTVVHDASPRESEIPLPVADDVAREDRPTPRHVSRVAPPEVRQRAAERAASRWRAMAARQHGAPREVAAEEPASAAGAIEPLGGEITPNAGAAIGDDRDESAAAAAGAAVGTGAGDPNEFREENDAIIAPPPAVEGSAAIDPPVENDVAPSIALARVAEQFVIAPPVEASAAMSARATESVEGEAMDERARADVPVTGEVREVAGLPAIRPVEGIPVPTRRRMRRTVGDQRSTALAAPARARRALVWRPAPEPPKRRPRRRRRSFFALAVAASTILVLFVVASVTGLPWRDEDSVEESSGTLSPGSVAGAIEASVPSSAATIAADSLAVAAESALDSMTADGAVGRPAPLTSALGVAPASLAQTDSSVAAAAGAPPRGTRSPAAALRPPSSRRARRPIAATRQDADGAPADSAAAVRATLQSELAARRARLDSLTRLRSGVSADSAGSGIGAYEALGPEDRAAILREIAERRRRADSLARALADSAVVPPRAPPR